MIPRADFVSTWYGSEEHRKYLSDFDRYELYYREQLEEIFQQMVDYWKLYTASREDRRKKDEKWRANVWVPHAYSGTATKAGAVKDIILSADPIVEARPMGNEDVAFQKHIENLIDHTFYINKANTLLGDILTAKYVQGVDLVKLSYKHDFSVVPYLPTEEDWNRLAEAMAKAKSAGGPPPPPMTEYDLFDLWRDEINAAFAGKGLFIPENPLKLNQNSLTINRFRGPVFQRTPIWDARFDPFVEGMLERNWFAVRSVRRYSELESLAGKTWAPDKPFSGEMLEMARKKGNIKGERERFQTWETEVQEMLYKTSAPAFADPAFDESCEVFEIYTPYDEIKHTVLVNREFPINWDPRVMPFDHQQIPYHLLRNIRIPGQAIGMSDYSQTKELFHELMTLRNLRLDAVTLRVLPVLMRTSGMSIPELQQRIRPGAIVDVNRADGLKSLMDAVGIPPEVWREDAEIKGDIDSAMGTSGGVRGRDAQINRVSANEFQGRFERAMGRLKDDAEAVQDELLPAIPQAISIYYQFFQQDERIEIAGAEAYPISAADLPNALVRDFRFRGATQAETRDAKVQQLMTLGEKFAGSLSPGELREVARRIAEAMGMKNVQQLLDSENTQVLEANYKKSKQLESMQMDLAGMNMQMQMQMGGMPPGGPGGPPEGGPEGGAA